MSAERLILDRFCPMHVRVSASGHILAVGCTLDKVARPQQLVGQRFLEMFEVSRPGGIARLADLRGAVGRKLSLRLRARRKTVFKGVGTALPDGGMALNLSFGISVIDAVRDHRLSASDFAPTELTVELLYLVEAKSLAMAASRRLNTRLRSAMIAAEEQAFTDTLTGLKNRRALDHVVNRLDTAAKPYAVINIDLDFFKEVNDRHGHSAGDFVLQSVARAMLDVTRKTDTLARVGGDEFVVVLPNTTGRKPVVDLCLRLISKLERPIRFGDADLRISSSIGVALSADFPGMPYAQLNECADVALYRAKRNGRAGYAVAAPDDMVSRASETP